MKKTLITLFAAAAFVGCDAGRDDTRTPIDEPAGAQRDPQMQQRGTIDTNTNALTDPAYAPAQPDTGAGADQGGAAGTGAGNP